MRKPSIVAVVGRIAAQEFPGKVAQIQLPGAIIALQLHFMQGSESMDNHDSNIVGACCVD